MPNSVLFYIETKEVFYNNKYCTHNRITHSINDKIVLIDIMYFLHKAVKKVH